MKTESENINPKVAYVEIGIRSLRKVKIYPLSLADETDLLEIVKEGFKELSQMGSSENSELEVAGFISFLLDLFVTNLGEVLQKVIDEYSPEMLKEIDNEQAFAIAEKMVEMNFGNVSKKVIRLLGGQGNELSTLWRRLLQSSPNILNSVSNTFTNTVSKTEDLQEDN